MSQDEHEWAWSLLSDYVGGGLSREDATVLEAHVASCGECNRALEELAQGELPLEGEAVPSRWQRLKSFLTAGSLSSRLLLAIPIVTLLAIVGFVLSELEGRPPKDKRGVSRDYPEGIEHLIAVDQSMRAPIEGEVFSRKSIPLDHEADPNNPQITFPSGRHVSADSADADSYRNMSGEEFLRYVSGEAKVRGRSAVPQESMGFGRGTKAAYGGRSFQGGMATVFSPENALAAARDQAERERVVSAPAPLEKIVRPPSGPPQEEAPASSPKIIRSVEMEFEIDSFEQAVATLTKLTLEERGFVATVNSEKLPNGKIRGSVVVRVPPDNLDRLLLNLRALGEIKSQRIGSQDVTRQFTDLEGRLRAARAMEERLLAIIKDGKGQIKDLLAAEKELGEWRSRIESMIGEINYLANGIAHSTLSITLAEKELQTPFAVLETEIVEMSLEVEDVEKALREALAAVSAAKGRVTRSDLKQIGAGQYNAILQFVVAPTEAAPLRDRFRQLGAVTHLDLHRTQETQGGTGPASSARLEQKETQMLVSLYNLATLVPRENVTLTLAGADAEGIYKGILERIGKAGAILLSSHLSRPKSDLVTGSLAFQVRSAEAEGVLRDLRSSGEVLHLETSESSDGTNVTRSKKGIQVTVVSLASLAARETSTIAVAAVDVGPAYRSLLDAARAAKARIVGAELNENDPKNVTGSLSFEVDREKQAGIVAAIDAAGKVYTRVSTRAPESDNTMDSKLFLHLRIFSSADIPARETVSLGIQAEDVDAAVAALEGEYKSRVIDVNHSRETSGRRQSVVTIDVPSKEAKGNVDRIRKLGGLRHYETAKNPGVPESPLSVTRLQVRISDDVLVAQDSGPVASLRKGLSVSLTAASWSLMLVMIGVCFVVPLVVVIWGAVRLHRRLHPKAAAPALP